MIAQGSLDRYLGSPIDVVKDFFTTHPNSAVTHKVFTGEHISALPLMNQQRYEQDRDMYDHASNTFYPGVYETVFEMYLKFFSKHFDRLNN